MSFDWDQYFMATALLASRKSNSVQQSGACIVYQNKKIVGVGFNGLPNRCDLLNPNTYECHAEINAILNCSNVKECAMYVTEFPCNECAKLIIQSGIKKVKYLSNYENSISKEMFEKAEIDYKEVIPISISLPGWTNITNIVDWDDYFMAMACLAAKPSQDPKTKVGACIVNQDKTIVGIGYNRMPNGCDFSWNKREKHEYVTHAELNAIVNKNSTDVKNCTIFVSMFPCTECAKLIIQSGIKEVVYGSDRSSKNYPNKYSKKMFDAADINYREVTPKAIKIIIKEVVEENNESAPKKLRLN